MVKSSLSTHLWQTGESKWTSSLTAWKRQDPNLIRGMATVSEESGTHLNVGKLNIFRAAYWHNA